MNRFLKGAMILTIAGIVVKIIGAFSKVLLARILGGEGIGLYQMAYPIYQIIVSLATAGLPVAISIMVADKLAHDDMLGAHKVFKVSAGMLFLLGAFFSILMFVSAPWLVAHGWVTDSRSLPALMALAPAILVVTVLSCLRGYFQGFQDMLPTGLSQVAEQFFRVVCMVGLAWWLMPKGLSWAAAGATFATLPGVVAGLMVLLYFYRRQKTVRQERLAVQNPDAIAESSLRIMKRMFWLAIPVSLANIMMPIVSGIDLGVVPRRLIETGYSVREATTLFGYLTGMATSLVNLPIILTTSLAASLVPAVSEAYAKGDKGEILNRSRVAMKITLVITVPAFIGLCVLATPISELLYVTPHAGGPIAVMSLSILLLGIQQVTTGILQGLGHTAIPMINLCVGTALKIPLSWYLTGLPELGIRGAAWSTNIDFGLAAILNIWFVRRYIGYKFAWGDTIKILFSALAMGGAAYLLYDFGKSVLGHSAAVGLAIIVAVVVYGAGLLVTKAMNDSELQAMPFIGKRLARRKAAKAANNDTNEEV